MAFSHMRSHMHTFGGCIHAPLPPERIQENALFPLALKTARLAPFLSYGRISGAHPYTFDRNNKKNACAGICARVCGARMGVSAFFRRVSFSAKRTVEFHFFTRVDIVFFHFASFLMCSAFPCSFPGSTFPRRLWR